MTFDTQVNMLNHALCIINFQELSEKVKQWAKEAGEDCTITFHAKNVKSPVVCTDDSDPWWRAFSSGCAKQ